MKALLALVSICISFSAAYAAEEFNATSIEIIKIARITDPRFNHKPLLAVKSQKESPDDWTTKYNETVRADQICKSYGFLKHKSYTMEQLKNGTAAVELFDGAPKLVTPKKPGWLSGAAHYFSEIVCYVE